MFSFISSIFVFKNKYNIPFKIITGTNEEGGLAVQGEKRLWSSFGTGEQDDRASKKTDVT